MVGRVRGRCLLTLSLSSTWNVAKLASQICSSSITCRVTSADAVGCGSMPPIAAEAPAASENDRPAAPSIGTALLALLRRFRRAASFLCGMTLSPLYGSRNDLFLIGVAVRDS